MPADHRQALYRTAQEALTNVQRHAKANHARVEVALLGEEQATNGISDTAIQISISDDGIGLDEALSTSGYGLRGLQERATHLGGALRIQPHTGGGTHLVMRLPLPAPHAIAVTDNGVHHG